VTFVSGLGGLALTVLVEWAGLFVMLCFTIWMIRHEQGLLKKHLREEVGKGLLSLAQYNTAHSFFQFGARMAALSSGTLMSTARFYQVCGELAHKKEQYEKFGDEKGNMRIIQNLRAEMQRLAPYTKA
jgi:hypothetical protein